MNGFWKYALSFLLFFAMAFPMLHASEAHAAGKVVRLQFGHDNHPGEPLTEAGLYWAKILKERSGGTMQMEIFPSGSLGSKNDLLDQMYAGDQVLVFANGPFCADRGVPDLGVTQAPYLFENWSQLETLIASDWWKEQSRLLAAKGMTIVGENFQYGTRHTLTNKKVIEPADFKGMKIRTQPSTIHVKGFSVLGAVPTPMALAEVYTSLQQGTIDGLENPIAVLYSGKYQETAKNLLLDAHIHDLSFVVCGTEFFNSLTPEQQQWLKETGAEASAYHNKLAKQAEADCLEKMKAEGVTVTQPDFTGFQKAAQSFYTDDMAKQLKWSDGLVEKIKSIIK